MKITALTTLFFAAPAAVYCQIQIVESGALSQQVNLNQTYSQVFDIPVAPFPGSPWTDNVTLPGWYSPSTVLSELGGGLLSLGPTGGAGDRALGLAGSTGGNKFFALRLNNLTSSNITGVSVGFDGEQWYRRRQGTGPQVTSALTFSYRIFNTNQGALYFYDDNTQWTYVPELTFVSPNATLNTNDFFMDGSAPENSVRDIQNLVTGFNVAPGQELWLRWGSQDVPYPSSPHGLGIDNLSVSFITSVPEPANTAMLAGWIVLLFTNRRWRPRPR